MEPYEDQTAVTAEQALRECERRFRDLMDMAVAWFWETDAFLRLLRLEGRQPLHPREAWIGRTRGELHGGNPTTSRWKEHIEMLRSRRPFQHFEYRTVTSDGQVAWLAASGQPAFAEDGTFRGYPGIAVDIAAHERAETAAREETALLEATLEPMDQGPMMFDATETVRVYNHRALELLDLPPELLQEQPDLKAIREYQFRRGEFRNSNEVFRLWVESRGIGASRDEYERVRPNGTILEIRTVPGPIGGAVQPLPTSRLAATRRPS